MYNTLSLYAYILQLYTCELIVKLTLSVCVWRWSCTRYTGADVGDAGGSGAT